MVLTPTTDPPVLDRRRWRALCCIALAQLMVALDVTVVNIAMPSAQAELGMSDTARQWIMAAYTLAFGGLLLFGGRVVDLAGRRRVFLLALVGFAVASAAGGAAVAPGMLIAARALQGVCGALLAPAALALLTGIFTDPGERARAFGIYSAIAGGGTVLGLMVGGALTEYLSWRWSMFINVPLALAAAVGALLVVGDPHPPTGARRLDLPGAALVSTGLVALVSAFAVAEAGGWLAPTALGLFGLAGVLLAGFVAVEARAADPLLPPRVVADRVRGGANLALALSVASMYALFLFMTYYLQTVRSYSPLRTGLAFLPIAVGLAVGSTQIAGRLPRVAPAAVMGWGFAAGAAGVLLLTRLEVGSGYTTLILPAGVLFGLGLGAAFVPAMNLATLGVDPDHAGVASALAVAAQQIGGSIGAVLLGSIAASATAAYPRPGAGGPTPERFDQVATVHGFAVASWPTAGLLLAAAVVTALLVHQRRPRP